MQRKPLIKGSLSRLRHLLYQFLLVPLVLFISIGAWEITKEMWPAAESADIVVAVAIGALVVLMALVFLVQRLHDAGYSGLWLLAVFFVNATLGIVSSSVDPLTAFVISLITLIPTIIICALPSKRENNPWIQHPEPPDEE